MYKTVAIVEDVIKVWKLFEKKIRIKVRIRKKDYWRRRDLENLETF